MSVLAHDYTVGAPGRFVWTATEPVRSAPTVTFTRPDGQTHAVVMQSASDITVSAIGADRRTLTASADLPDPADAGAVWLIYDDRRTPDAQYIVSGDPSGRTIKLAEPIPHDVQADQITVQHAVWLAGMTAGGPLSVQGVGTWKIEAEVYNPDGTNADAEYVGAYRAERRFDTGLTSHMLLDVRADLVAHRRRRASLDPVIAQALQRIKERVRAAIHPSTLTIVQAPGDFVGVHIDMVDLALRRKLPTANPAIIELEAADIRDRLDDLIRTLPVDRDADGAVDAPKRRRRDAGGRNSHTRIFETHPKRSYVV